MLAPDDDMPVGEVEELRRPARELLKAEEADRGAPTKDNVHRLARVRRRIEELANG